MIWVACGDVHILRRGVGIDVGVVMRHGSSASVHTLRRFFTVFAEPLKECKERLIAEGKIAAVRDPVVHLHVYVDGEFRIPGRSQGIIPDALEICGK